MAKQKEIPWTSILVVTALFTTPFILGGMYNIVASFFGPRGFELAGPNYWSLLNGFVSFFAGAGILALALWGKRWDLRRTRIRDSALDKPWLWKDAWRTGRIRDSSRRIILFLAIFTAIVILGSSPTWFISWKLIHQSPVDVPKLAAALVFPAVGTVLLLILFVQFVRWTKVGTTYFEMATLPGVIGGKLAGTIRIRRQLEPDGGFRLRLSCIKTTGGSGRESTSQHVLHQEELTVARELLSYDYSQTAIPVLFGIPYTAQPTGDRVHWQLAVEAKLPGADYRTHFVVPVFKTAESSPSFQLDESPVAQYVDQRTPDEVLREQRIYHEPQSEGEVFRFPMFRVAVNGAVLALASIVWLGAVVLLFRKREWIVGGGFVLFGLPVWWITLDHLFWRSRVEIRHGRVQLRDGLFGWRRRTFAASDVIGVVAEGGSQMNLKLYYNVKFVLHANHGNKKLTVGKRITDKKVADMLADMYQDALRR